MGIEISNIKNSELQKIAAEIDAQGNKNGKIDGKETSIFNEKKNSFERAEKTVFRHLDNIIEANKTKRSGLIEALDTKLGTQKDDARYVELKTSITEVMSLMPETYASYKDIKDQHNTVLSKLEEKGLKDDLHKEILDKLEEIAKAEVLGAAVVKIDEQYKEAAKTETNSEKIMDSMKDSMKKDKTFKAENKDAFKYYESNIIMVNAKESVLRTIEEVAVKANDNGKDIQNATKEALKAKGEWNKYTEKVLFGDKNIFKVIGNWAANKKSTGRMAADNRARAEKVEESKTKTEKEVLKALGKKSTVFEALVSNELISQKEDGSYDLSVISSIIRQNVGANYKMDRNAKIDKAISEKLRTTGAAAIATQLEDLTEGEAKQLAKLCGYEIEGVNWKKVIIGGILGLMAGGAAGAAGTAMQPNKSVLVEGDVVNHNLNLTLNGDFDPAALGPLPEGITATQTGTGVTIKIAQQVVQPDRLVKFIKNLWDFAPTTIVPALVGAALGALAGLEDKGEVPETVTQFSETDITKYLERVRKETPEYATILEPLAMSFIKNGKWDVEGYKQLLNSAAGDGGKLNIEEATGMVQESYRKKDAPVEEVKEQTVVTNEKEPDPDRLKTSQHTTKIQEKVPTIDGSKTTWAKIAGQYGNLVKDYDVSKAIRILKLAQAINNGDYSKENLEELMKLSYENRNALKSIEGFDYDAFNSALLATYLGKDVKVPDNLAGYGRDASISLTPGKVNKRGPVRHPSKGSAPDYTERNGETIYGLKVNDQAVQTYTSEAERNKEAEKYPNAKKEEVKWEELNK